MKRKKTLYLAVLTSLFIAVFLVGCSERKKSCVFVQDQSWKMLEVDSLIKPSKRALRKKGIRLKTVTVDYDGNTNAESLTVSLMQLKGAKRIVLNPVLANACNLLRLNIKELLPESEITAITRNNPNSYFDYIFIPDTDEIWKVVREYIGKASNVKICRTAKVLYNYLEGIDLESDFNVVTDYKMRKVVPEKNLAGIVVPDFAELFSREISEDSECGNIEYIFRMTKMEFEYDPDTDINNDISDTDEEKHGLTTRMF